MIWDLDELFSIPNKIHTDTAIIIKYHLKYQRIVTFYLWTFFSKLKVQLKVNWSSCVVERKWLSDNCPWASFFQSALRYVCLGQKLVSLISLSARLQIGSLLREGKLGCYCRRCRVARSITSILEVSEEVGTAGHLPTGDLVELWNPMDT